MDAFEPREHLADLIAGKHHRQPCRRFGFLDTVEPRQLATQHLLVEEEQRAPRLILGCRGHPTLHCQRGEESLHLVGSQPDWMALAMENDEASNPIAIRLLGTDAVVLDPNFAADLVE